MRIGLLTTGYPRFDGDVAGHFVGGFAEALCERGHSVEVLAPEPDAPGHPPPVRERGATLTWVPYMRPRSWAQTFYGAGAPDNLRHSRRAQLGVLPFVASMAAHAHLRRQRWDAVVSHWALPCGLIASTLELPHLCVVHSADMHALLQLPVSRALSAPLIRARTRMWFSAPHLRSQFASTLSVQGQHWLTRNAHVGPMGFEPPIGSEALSAPPRSEYFTLLVMARLVPIKGIDVLLRATARRTDLRVWIAGEGPEEAGLRALADEIGAPARFCGHVAGRAKAELFAGADAFVLPSRTLPSGRAEGFPTALLEAMAAGLPIIATRSGGIDSLIEHGQTGMLVPPDAPDALAAAIDTVATSAHLRRSLTVRARARSSEHRWPQVAARAERLLVDASHET